MAGMFPRRESARARNSPFVHLQSHKTTATMMCKRPLLSCYYYGAAAALPSVRPFTTTVVPSIQLQLLQCRCILVRNSNGSVLQLCRRRPIISHRVKPVFATNHEFLSLQKRQLGSKSKIYASKHGKAIVDTSNAQDDAQNSGNNDYHSPPDDIIEAISLAWITKVVIGYNLCPFAERPLRDNKLKISVVRGADDHTVASAVAYELLARSEESQVGSTSVVVAPEYHPTDFNAYLSLVQFLEEGVMEEHDLHGIVQIAPFHPQFEFDGSGSDGMDNYTNRSPYPMFHILREDDVSKAVDKMGGDASKVWRRNIALMQTMEERFGREEAVRAMKGDESIHAMDGLLRELKLSGYREEDN